MCPADPPLDVMYRIRGPRRESHEYDNDKIETRKGDGRG
jgi:hypothetical protein